MSARPIGSMRLVNEANEYEAACGCLMLRLSGGTIEVKFCSTHQAAPVLKGLVEGASVMVERYVRDVPTRNVAAMSDAVGQARAMRSVLATIRGELCPHCLAGDMTDEQARVLDKFRKVSRKHGHALRMKRRRDEP